MDFLTFRLYSSKSCKQYIVELPHEYLFSSAIDYADGKGLVAISKL